MSETITVVAIIFGGLGIWLIMHRQGRLRYRKKTLLTGSELEFFLCLKRALPECVVAPKVAATALIEPVGIGPARQAALARIASHRVGYAIFDDQMQLLVIVELDHRRRKRTSVAADRYFADAGIRTLRFSAKQLPSDLRIRSAVFIRVPLQERQRNVSLTGDAPEIEFKRPQNPWRNTINVRG